MSSEIMLGDDTECEMCGWSYNTLYYNLDTATGVHSVQTSVGCYGGESCQGSVGTVVNFLTGYRDCSPEVNELISWLCR